MSLAHPPPSLSLPRRIRSIVVNRTSTAESSYGNTHAEVSKSLQAGADYLQSLFLSAHQSSHNGQPCQCSFDKPITVTLFAVASNYNAATSQNQYIRQLRDQLNVNYETALLFSGHDSLFTNIPGLLQLFKSLPHKGTNLTLMAWKSSSELFFYSGPEFIQFFEEQKPSTLDEGTSPRLRFLLDILSLSVIKEGRAHLRRIQVQQHGNLPRNKALMNHVATLDGVHPNSADNTGSEDRLKRPRQVAEEEYTTEGKKARREAGYEKQRLQYTPIAKLDDHSVLCPCCSESFTTESAAITHAVQLCNEKNQCLFCDHTDSQKRSLPAALRKHVSAHIKIREVCGINGCIHTPPTFVQLKQHRENFHSAIEKRATETKPVFNCTHCDVTCSSSSNLRKHVRGQHENAWEGCKYCGNFVRYRDMKRHHTHVCDKVQQTIIVCPEPGCNYRGSTHIMSRHIRRYHTQAKEIVNFANNFDSQIVPEVLRQLVQPKGSAGSPPLPAASGLSTSDDHSDNSITHSVNSHLSNVAVQAELDGNSESAICSSMDLAVSNSSVLSEEKTSALPSSRHLRRHQPVSYSGLDCNNESDSEFNC